MSCIPSTTDCVVSDSKDKVFYATNVSTTAKATWNSWKTPTGERPSQAVACPTTTACVLAQEAGGNKSSVYGATSLGGSFTEVAKPGPGVNAVSCASASFCVAGRDRWGAFDYSTTPTAKSWYAEELAPENETENINGVFCLSSTFCALVDSQGKLHVATSTSQIESTSWKETDVDGSTALNGVACTSTKSCAAVDGTGDVVNLGIESSGAATASKYNIDGTNDLTAITCSGSTCVTVDNAGNIFVSSNAGEGWTKQQDALGDDLTSVSCASAALCMTVDSTGNTIAISTSTAISEGEHHGPGPWTTIDYNVPVSGAGAPHNMSESEVAKWGQKAEEKPVEATAIFPANEPQGGPLAATNARVSTISMNKAVRSTSRRPAHPPTGRYRRPNTTNTTT